MGFWHGVFAMTYGLLTLGGVCAIVFAAFGAMNDYNNRYPAPLFLCGCIAFGIGQLIIKLWLWL